MRKLMIAATLTLVLAGTASASNDGRFGDRSPRDRDNPIVRIIKTIKRLLTPANNDLPSQPVP
jgi:hypothetical protein